MSAPATDNKALETFDGIASEVALNLLLPVAEKAAEGAAEGAAPFLALPIVKQVFEAFADEAMSLAAHAMLTAFVQAGVKIIVTIQTEEEKMAYQKAEGALRAALLSKDPTQIQSARKEFENAADAIVHSDGSLNHHAE